MIGDTNEPFIIKDGNLLDSSVISIKEGKRECQWIKGTLPQWKSRYSNY